MFHQAPSDEFISVFQKLPMYVLIKLTVKWYNMVKEVMVIQFNRRRRCHPLKYKQVSSDLLRIVQKITLWLSW